MTWKDKSNNNNNKLEFVVCLEASGGFERAGGLRTLVVTSWSWAASGERRRRMQGSDARVQN